MVHSFCGAPRHPVLQSLKNGPDLQTGHLNGCILTPALYWYSSIYFLINTVNFLLWFCICHVCQTRTAKMRRRGFEWFYYECRDLVQRRKVVFMAEPQLSNGFHKFNTCDGICWHMSMKRISSAMSTSWLCDLRSLGFWVICDFGRVKVLNCRFHLLSVDDLAGLTVSLSSSCSGALIQPGNHITGQPLNWHIVAIFTIFTVWLIYY